MLVPYIDEHDFYIYPKHNNEILNPDSVVDDDIY